MNSRQDYSGQPNMECEREGHDAIVVDAGLRVVADVAARGDGVFIALHFVDEHLPGSKSDPVRTNPASAHPNHNPKPFGFGQKS